MHAASRAKTPGPDRKPFSLLPPASSGSCSCSETQPITCIIVKALAPFLARCFPLRGPAPLFPRGVCLLSFLWPVDMYRAPPTRTQTLKFAPGREETDAKSHDWYMPPARRICERESKKHICNARQQNARKAKQRTLESKHQLENSIQRPGHPIPTRGSPPISSALYYTPRSLRSAPGPSQL